ncbi:hypothetical protein V1512DRAFT_288908 [Lipomyces arxii]|uniref:uncharacterized protein n=1 Tax=Lipomyces arxii TaxID=56418 RepID=UPI0034CDD26A
MIMPGILVSQSPFISSTGLNLVQGGGSSGYGMAKPDLTFLNQNFEFDGVKEGKSGQYVSAIEDEEDQDEHEEQEVEEGEDNEEDDDKVKIEDIREGVNKDEIAESNVESDKDETYEEPATTSRKRSASAELSSGRAKRPRPKCYNCTYDGCEKAFTRPCRLEEHLRSHTGERPFVCSLEGCNKSFLRDSHLKAHESSHKEDKRYKCPECGHGFNTNQHLKRHMPTHELKLPYACTDFAPCTEAFRKQSQLRKHVSDEHTHMKPFVCPVEGCGKSFAQNSRLKVHQDRDHSEQPRYLCGRILISTDEDVPVDPECGAGFHTWSALQKHIKTDHKAICAICRTIFAKASVLKAHMRLHEATLEERRKFCCDICGTRFTKRNAMTVHHQTVHERRKPFVCEEEGCGKAFGHKRLWTEHVAKMHNGEDVATEAKKEIKKFDRAPLIVQSGLIDRLAGTGYENTGRHLNCTFAGCEFKFAREYDLTRHLSSVHSLVDDVFVDPSLLL